MTIDAWFPIGYQFPDNAKVRFAIHSDNEWQILETEGAGRALVSMESLASKWIEAGLLTESDAPLFSYGAMKYRVISCGESQVISPVADCKSPSNRNEAMAFAQALFETRKIDKQSSLHDSIYVEKFSRLFPTFSISVSQPDDVVLGYWLTGGAPISVKSFRRLHNSMSWLDSAYLKEIIEAGGFKVDEVILKKPKVHAGEASIVNESYGMVAESKSNHLKDEIFLLPGREELTSFFNDHIIDIVKNRERYKALGIDFPAAVILHGPPGCGKTFAVEKLVEYLGWPSFEIDASSVASPYIHETSKKVADVFEKAMENSPSVLVIDEMEAFLADRSMGSGHHRVEEMAEFLRRIPEAIKNEVLIVAMTNRIDMIDSAILRRGRFDHVIKVDFASKQEVQALLSKLISALPKEDDVDCSAFLEKLVGRPLSDVTFVIREGARIAAKSGKNKLDQASLLQALDSTPARNQDSSVERKIGFL